MPAFKELPMISVVQPAYHCDPNGGHPSFCPSGNRRLSCVLVFATGKGQCMSLKDCEQILGDRTYILQDM